MKINTKGGFILNKNLKMISLSLAGLFVILSLAYQEVQALAKVSRKAPGFRLKDTYGKSHSLSKYKGKFVVLEWFNHECPFVKKHYGKSKNMQTLQKEFTKKGVIWLSVNSSAKGKQGNFPPKKANWLTKKKKASPTAVLIDESGKVGKSYGAKTTPHLFVINPKGNTDLRRCY